MKAINVNGIIKHCCRRLGAQYYLHSAEANTLVKIVDMFGDGIEVAALFQRDTAIGSAGGGVDAEATANVTRGTGTGAKNVAHVTGNRLQTIPNVIGPLATHGLLRHEQ